MGKTKAKEEELKEKSDNTGYVLLGIFGPVFLAVALVVEPCAYVLQALHKRGYDKQKKLHELANEKKQKEIEREKEAKKYLLEVETVLAPPITPMDAIEEQNGIRYLVTLQLHLPWELGIIVFKKKLFMGSIVTMASKEWQVVDLMPGTSVTGDRVTLSEVGRLW